MSAGANVNARDLWAFTPLHEAAAKGRKEVCELLLARGADPLFANCHGRTTIEMAPSRELQQRLLQEYRGYSLLEACASADIGRVKKLLSSFPEAIHFRSMLTGNGVLHCAILGRENDPVCSPSINSNATSNGYIYIYIHYGTISSTIYIYSREYIT